MIQSQDLLSRLGIPYFDCQTQADVDARAQAVIACYRAMKAGTYQSPKTAVADAPIIPDMRKIASRSALVLAMQAAELAGDVDTVHADLDQINASGAAIGFTPITVKPDIEILANAAGETGRFAQRVLNGDSSIGLLSNVTAAGPIIEAAIATTPRPPAAKVAVTIQVGQPNDEQPAPAGTVVRDSAGIAWQFVATPFGLFWIRMAAVVLAVVLSMGAARAQVTVKFSPEPMAVPLSQLSNARDLGRWKIAGCNGGAAPVTLTSEQLSIASPLADVDFADAALTLNSHAKKTFWGYVKQWAPIAGSVVAMVLTHTGTISGSTGTIVAIGSTEGIPLLESIANQQAASPAALLTTLQYPLTLAPRGAAGACFTDHMFTAKMPAAQLKPAVVVIQ